MSWKGESTRAVLQDLLGVPVSVERARKVPLENCSWFMPTCLLFVPIEVERAAWAKGGAGCVRYLQSSHCESTRTR